MQKKKKNPSGCYLRVIPAHASTLRKQCVWQRDTGLSHLLVLTSLPSPRGSPRRLLNKTGRHSCDRITYDRKLPSSPWFAHFDEAGGRVRERTLGARRRPWPRGGQGLAIPALIETVDRQVRPTSSKLEQKQNRSSDKRREGAGRRGRGRFSIRKGTPLELRARVRVKEEKEDISQRGDSA